MNQPLTKTQSKVLAFIKSFIKEKKTPPTIKEIAIKFKYKSHNAAYEVLKILEKKEYIKRSRDGKSRSLIIIDDTENDSSLLQSTSNSIIIIGKGNSLNPMSIFMNPLGQLNIDENLFDIRENLIASIAQDNSLLKEGILKNDYLIVSQTVAWDNGDKVLAILNETIIARIVKQNSNHIQLISTERGYPKIDVEPNDRAVKILGKIIGIIRNNI